MDPRTNKNPLQSRRWMSRLSSECVSGWQRAKQRHTELENPERQSMWLQSYSACFASPTLNPVSCPLWREHKMLQVKPRTGRVAPWQHRPNSSAHKRRREGRERAERGRLHGVSRGKLSIYSKTVTHFIHSKQVIKQVAASTDEKQHLRIFWMQVGESHKWDRMTTTFSHEEKEEIYF